MSIVVFEHSSRTGSLRMGATLRDFGHRLHVVHLHEGDPIPPNFDDVDAVISCSGAPSCNDASVPWLEAELEYLREAHERGLSVVGLCLGSQMVARALGGTVGPMDGGELGWHDVTLTPVGCEDALHAGIAWTSTQPMWHFEEVKELPAGARRLGTGARCANQTWAVGLRTYAFQYHPEIDEDTIDLWAADEPDALRQAGLTRDQLRQQTREHYPVFERLSQRLFDAMALLLMPIDRRYAGVAKELHH